jgi:hypothetical protein
LSDNYAIQYQYNVTHICDKEICVNPRLKIFRDYGKLSTAKEKNPHGSEQNPSPGLFPFAVLWVLASFHLPSHDASHCRQVYAEVLGDFAIGIGSGRVRRRNGGVSVRRMRRDLRQRRRTALRLRDAQPIPLDPGLTLYAFHERFVSQIDMSAYSLPNILSHAFVHEGPVTTTS